MCLFKKKDKRHNNYYDNTANMYKGHFSVALFYIVIFIIVYAIHTLYNYLF
ncbi:hypothetical protein DFR65_101207 [Oceanihabitans sediminis]|nr:hypothetical protein DFR65_101207 [Oceanihabitans sediminis]